VQLIKFLAVKAILDIVICYIVSVVSNILLKHITHDREPWLV